MLILAGEAKFQEDIKEMLVGLGYIEDTLLASFHARGMFAIAPAAGADDLLAWATNRRNEKLPSFAGLMDKSPISAHEWRARIKQHNQAYGGEWYIHDFRPIWFFDDFREAAGEIRIIALISDETDYHKAIGRFLEARLPDDVPTLKVTKPPTLRQLETFLKSPPATGAPDEIEGASK